MKAYKFLSAGGVGRFSNVAWPPPGEWLEAHAPLDRCQAGIHACSPPAFLDWLDDELWEIELDGAVEHDDGTIVALRGRLVGRVDRWDGSAAARFTAFCVDRAHAGAVTALRSAGHDAAALGAAAQLVADCRVLAVGGRPGELPGTATGEAPSPAAIAANVGFVAAHAAASAAAAAGGDYAATFADERRRQLDWLRVELRA